MGKLQELENKLNELTEEFNNYKNEVHNFAMPKEPGDEFEFYGIKWIVLEINDKQVKCIVKDFYNNDMKLKFDRNNNNWVTSDLRGFLNNDYCEQFKNFLVYQERDLLSLDGQTQYGKCRDRVTLLTVDEYRKYRKYLPNTNGWWWLCTPYSTEDNRINYSVCTVVHNEGVIGSQCFDVIGCYARPVCVFDFSSLF